MGHDAMRLHAELIGPPEQCLRLATRDRPPKALDDRVQGRLVIRVATDRAGLVCPTDLGEPPRRLEPAPRSGRRPSQCGPEGDTAPVDVPPGIATIKPILKHLEAH